MHIVALIPHPKTALSSLLIADAAGAVAPGSAITALHVCVDPAKIGGSVEEIDMQEMRIREEGTAFQRRDQVRAIFEDWAARREQSPARATAEWVEVDSGEEDAVRNHLGSADLVTIARPQSMDGGDALHAALFDHRSLLLFTPEIDCAPKFLGRSIAVLWKDDEETRSCLQKAALWLRSAVTISILVERAGDLEAAVAFLGIVEPSPHAHIETGLVKHGKDFIEKAKILGADTLLMGAYRHGQFVEAVFGGDTKAVLDGTDLPVFLSH
ncbi:hypothetical protein [Agrobacterium tumefaciens]|uniref:hypothetical protein n=1 Tax=Agrobacterium tumefaciens TaxID=358 RepID=UPI00157191E4|nr:hypothetical protein [Agrobacterium tumefaciens]NTD11767.1 hypothetical protein [Agrobacterium tumefaciens]